MKTSIVITNQKKKQQLYNLIKKASKEGAREGMIEGKLELLEHHNSLEKLGLNTSNNIPAEIKKRLDKHSVMQMIVLVLIVLITLFSNNNETLITTLLKFVGF